MTRKGKGMTVVNWQLRGGVAQILVKVVVVVVAAVMTTAVTGALVVNWQ